MYNANNEEDDIDIRVNIITTDTSDEEELYSSVDDTDRYPYRRTVTHTSDEENNSSVDDTERYPYRRNAIDMTFIFNPYSEINFDITDIADFRQSFESEEGVENTRRGDIEILTFSPLVAHDIFENMQTNLIQLLDQNILDTVLTESLNAYQTREKKPEQKVDINCVKYSKEKTNYTMCTVCTENFNKDEEVSVLECEHVFHYKCVKEWGMYKSECPICRKDIQLINENK
jgi:hypothetical protein